ncbi:MAG: quinolinate synthase NadA [candidate division Zixibacteria bacterium]|nr:quinolinate synthase NadA [candidate division Zixibacteria bacterium]
MYYSLPQEYREAKPDEIRSRLHEVKDKLGSKLLVLTHHYQRIEVVEFGDHLGDSYGLSKIAADQNEVEIIAFCGVHFMAEAADILTSDRQTVYLPNPLAGCPMADMADMADVMEAWECLQEFGGAEKITPISYMNTTAALKAFTGRNGGLICTSSNADAALKWAFEQREKVFFFPDQHLGRNTAFKMGFGPDEIITWDFTRSNGGLTGDQLTAAKVILWKGHCHVHTNFRPEHVSEVREKYPDAKVIVHPECANEVVRLTDGSGSTSYIVNYCEEAPAGSTIAIGTEINLINRMAQKYPDKTIFELSGQTCPVCANMYRTTLGDLLYTLEHHDELTPVHVDEPDRSEALVALEKMLQIV